MKKKVIICAANDRGGMNAILPVLRILKKQHDLHKFFTGPARERAKEEKITYKKIPNLEKITQSELAKKIARTKPDFIFLGTSSGVMIEKKLTRVAHKLHIPCAALLDSWVNYRFQFSYNNEGSFTERDLPDHIFIIDEIARREMIIEGFPRKRLHITGNPFFESFKPLPKPPTIKKKTILFADQHFSELLKRGLHEELGFEEQEVFGDVATALESLKWNGTLLIGYHPGSHDRTRYDKTIKNSSLEIKTAPTNTPIETLLRKTHLVVGMNSMVLFEAALGGKTVVSYQPHLISKIDPLMSNRLGLSFPAYNKKELKGVLRKALASTKPHPTQARLMKKYTKGNAAVNVVKKIDQILRTSI